MVVTQVSVFPLTCGLHGEAYLNHKWRLCEIRFGGIYKDTLFILRIYICIGVLTFCSPDLRVASLISAILFHLPLLTVDFTKEQSDVDQELVF